MYALITGVSVKKKRKELKCWNKAGQTMIKGWLTWLSNLRTLAWSDAPRDALQYWCVNSDEKMLVRTSRSAVQASQRHSLIRNRVHEPHTIWIFNKVAVSEWAEELQWNSSASRASIKELSTSSPHSTAVPVKNNTAWRVWEIGHSVRSLPWKTEKTIHVVH